MIFNNHTRRLWTLKLAIRTLLIILAAGEGVNASILAVDDSGGAAYTKIQDAINDSDPGDTILVYDGIYYENVNVTKKLILQGIDTGSGAPSVNAGGNGSAITLSAGDIILEGFNTVAGSETSFSSGILVQSNNNTIRNNIVQDNNIGVELSNSSNNLLIENNIANNSRYGIFLNNSGNNNIYNNYFNNSNNFILTNSPENRWNITETPASNIIGGSYQGGNFWADPYGAGFSQTCADRDINGICDSSYEIAGSNTDYLPLAIDRFLLRPFPEGIRFVQLTDVHLGVSMGAGIENCLNSRTNLTGEVKFYDLDECRNSLRDSVDKYKSAVEDIVHLKPDFVLITGDMVQWNDWRQYELFNIFTRKLTDNGIKVYAVPGNHDRRGYENPNTLWDALCYSREGKHIPECPYNEANNFINYFGDEINYYFDYPDPDGYRFIGLDSGFDKSIVSSLLVPPGSGFSNDQMSFLEENVIPNRTIIFMHHPVIDYYNKGIVSSYDNSSDISNNKENFTNLVKNKSVRLVLAGHTHDSKFYDLKRKRFIFNDEAAQITIYNRDDSLKELITEFTSIKSPLFVQTRSGRYEDNTPRGYLIVDVGRIASQSSEIYLKDVKLINDKAEMVALYLFSPADLHAYDESGRHTGLNPSVFIENNIPESYYIEESRIGNITIPASVFLYNRTLNYTIKINSNFSKGDVLGESANFTLLIEHRTSNAITTIDYRNVSIGLNSAAYLQLNTGQTNYTMQIDLDNDNINDTEKIPDSIITNREPIPVILSPSNDSEWEVGQPVSFRGTVIDDEDSPTLSTWISDRDDLIGYGDFTADDLSPGVHNIILMANDTTGQINTSNIVLTIRNYTAPITPTPPEPDTRQGSSGSSGGGGGGGGSDEDPTNIEFIEKYDLEILKDVTTSYRFRDNRNPIMFVNITGNTSLGVITTSAEVLKDTSTLVNAKPGGNVYRNVNIWFGTRGMATPKNIREASVKFRVDNAWMSANGLSDSDILLMKWDGTSWIQLETIETTKDKTYTYFEGKTNAFSPFAISSLKKAAFEEAARTGSNITEKAKVRSTRVPAERPSTKAPETTLNWVLFVFTALVLGGIIKVMYLIRK